MDNSEVSLGGCLSQLTSLAGNHEPVTDHSLESIDMANKASLHGDTPGTELKDFAAGSRQELEHVLAI